MCYTSPPTSQASNIISAEKDGTMDYFSYIMRHIPYDWYFHFEKYKYHQ